MNKKHDPTSGCETCQDPSYPGFAPKLEKLKVKNHPASNGSRLTACELEVEWDGKCLDGRAGLIEGFAPSTLGIIKRWGASKGKDNYGLYGFEACMAPASGSYLINECEDFQAGFAVDGVYVTEKCGGHVHVDARDFCVDDLCKLLQVFRFVEPALFKMLPAWRREIGQCQRLGDFYMDCGLSNVKGLASAEKFKKKLDSIYGGNHRGRNIPRGGYHERHCSLNVSSWFTLGTMEFRIPPGLIRTVDILGWTSVFKAVMDYSRGTKFLKIQANELIPTKVPTIAESIQHLNSVLEKNCPEALPWAIQQQKHGTKIWTSINGKKVQDIKLFV